MRSYTSTCHPARRNSGAAKRPAIEPPITTALGSVRVFPRPSFMSSPPFRLFAESDRDAPYLSFDQLWRCHCAKSTIIYHLINKILRTAPFRPARPSLGADPLLGSIEQN